MNMSELLRRDLTRIFRGHDPLNHIENLRIEETPDGTHCVAHMKVAQVPPYLGNHPVFCARPLAQPTLEALAAQAKVAAMLGEFASREVQNAPATRIISIEAVDLLKPTKIIYSGPKTVVFWLDGTKTIVSLMEGQEYDEYTAYCAAVVKKLFGSTYKAKKFLESVAVRPEPKPKKVKEEARDVAVESVEEQEYETVPHSGFTPLSGAEV